MPAAPRKKTTNMHSSITAWLQKPTVVTKPGPQKFHDVDSTVPSIPLLEHSATSSNPDPALNTLPIEAQHAPKPRPSALPPLPANVELVPLTEELMPAFKRLTSLTLPIAYPPAFFAETMEEPYHGITLMALWHIEPPNDAISPQSEKPRLVGAIRCRILPSSTLYLSTLGLLSPYRSYGIATHLLQRIIVKASREHGVKCVTAHVWEANDDGLEWYKKRGFEIIGKEERYYTKLKPSGAVLVRKWIVVADILGDVDMSAKLKE